MKTLTIILGCVSCLSYIAISQAAGFINHRYDQAPVKTCQPVDQNVNRIVYIDDVGVVTGISNREDSNGVQDLAVVLGLSAKYSDIDIIAIATSSVLPGSAKIVDEIIRASATGISSYSRTGIVQKIIAEAQKHRCSPNNKLKIAIGGEWTLLQCAIDPDFGGDASIVDYIEVVGIGGSNINSSSESGCPGYSYQPKSAAYHYLTGALPTGSVKVIEEGDFYHLYTTTQGFSATAMNHFYATAILPVLDTVTVYGTNITTGIYIAQAENFNSRGASLNANTGNSKNIHHLRLADFLTIAYIKWRNSKIFDKNYILDRSKLGLDLID